MLTQRIAKNASALLVGDEINPEVAFLLGKDTNAFRDILIGLNKGSNDADSRTKLEELERAFKEYQGAISSILGNMQPLVLSKQAGSRIFRESEDLLKATDNLAAGLSGGPAERAFYIVAADCDVGLAASQRWRCSPKSTLRIPSVGHWMPNSSARPRTG
jgi:twitching motility protein PilJ